jgi:hypothetical protein
MGNIGICGYKIMHKYRGCLAWELAESVDKVVM